MKARDARVLLTGASGGIGQAAANALAKAGAAVMLAGRSPGRVSALARELTQRHGVSAARIDWTCADLGNPAEIDRLAATAADWGCNALVHNAGVPAFGRIEAIGGAAMQEVLQTNLLAPMLLTQALLPHLRRQPAAQVLFVGSATGRIALPGFAVYSASKFGLRGFAEALRRELADTAIAVQYLGPRATRTDFNNEAATAYNQATGSTTDSAEQVAMGLLRLLESQDAERFLGFPEKLAVRLNGLMPAWLDGAFAKHRQHLPPLPTTPEHQGPAR